MSKVIFYRLQHQHERRACNSAIISRLLLLWFSRPNREVVPDSVKILQHHFDQHLLVFLIRFLLSCDPHFHQERLDELEGNSAILIHGFMRFRPYREIYDMSLMIDILAADLME